MCCFEGSPISHGPLRRSGPARLPHRRPPRVPEDALNASCSGSAPAGSQPLASSACPHRSMSPAEAGQGERRSRRKAPTWNRSQGGTSCPGAAGRPRAFGSSPARVFLPQRAGRAQRHEHLAAEGRLPGPQSEEG